MDIRIRIMTLARQIFCWYKDDVDDAKISIIESVLNQFDEYIKDQSDDWDELYELVLGEDGIWEYSEFDNDLMPEKERDMWGLELCVLCCFIKLEICRMGDVSPQDMEMKEENIESYINFVEKNFQKVDGPRACDEFYGKYICY